jgi:hypothetical protein
MAIIPYNCRVFAAFCYFMNVVTELLRGGNFQSTQPANRVIALSESQRSRLRGAAAFGNLAKQAKISLRHMSLEGPIYTTR